MSDSNTQGAPEAKKEKDMDEMWGEGSARGNTPAAGESRYLRDGRYGMFMHWGLYSSLQGVWKGKTYYGIGEWIMHHRMANIPVEEYVEIAKDFNPVDFDARGVVALAREAGMKYIIITSKHHEGFAMYDSKVDKFNIARASAFGRDPMKELADACREAGLGFGFYYSHFQDWTAPGGAGGPAVNIDGSPASFEQYFYRKCLPQVNEITTEYGPLAFVWFDTPGDMEKKYIQELYNLVRKNQPGALVNSRIGHGWGDYSSEGDMEIPPRNIDKLWEACDTTNDSWCFAWYDQNWKSGKEILKRLTGAAARGGAYLLNVGPDALGLIPTPAAHFLRQAGGWLRRYPRVVYGAGASPWEHAQPWGDVTTQDDGRTLYLTVFEWPKDGKLHLPGLKTEIGSAKLLRGEEGAGVADDERFGEEIYESLGDRGGDKTTGVADEVAVRHEQIGGWVCFHLPFAAPEALASVLEVKLKEDAIVDSTHGVFPNIATEHLVEFAEVSGAEKKKAQWMEKFGEWKFAMQASRWSADGKAVWTVDVLTPGYYLISLRYKGVERAVWRVESDEGAVTQNQQPATLKYQTHPMGIMEFKKAGRHVLSVSLLEGDREASSLEAMEIEAV